MSTNYLVCTDSFPVYPVISSISILLLSSVKIINIMILIITTSFPACVKLRICHLKFLQATIIACSLAIHEKKKGIKKDIYTFHSLSLISTHSFSYIYIYINLISFIHTYNEFLTPITNRLINLDILVLRN